MSTRLEMPAKPRISLHDRLKQLRKETGYQPADDKPKIIEINAKNLDDKKLKKESKKVHKQATRAYRRKIWSLFLECSEYFQRELAKMEFNEMATWLLTMEETIADANSTRKVTFEEWYQEPAKSERVDDYTIPDDRMEEYEAYIEDKEVTVYNMDILRAKFLDKIDKKVKKYKKSNLNLYDPLFHGTGGNLEEMRRNLQSLTVRNARRLDQFNDHLRKMFGDKIDHHPAIMAFREKTDRIMKNTQKVIDDLKVGKLPVKFMM